MQICNVYRHIRQSNYLIFTYGSMVYSAKSIMDDGICVRFRSNDVRLFMDLIRVGAYEAIKDVQTNKGG